MYKQIDQRLNQLVNRQQQGLLQGGKIGLEKESLRVSTEGTIAHTPHPKVLGSALTHPYITTDYSEALLEFITPPCNSAAEALRFLENTQAFVYTRLNHELLWATSMPCIVSGEGSIPIAYYGHSNAGWMKHIYRRGLGYRYGRMMQVIAGVHYNYSLPDAFWPAYQTIQEGSSNLQDFISECYFSMIRNLRRLGWVVPYLFGASPTVCKSFIDGPAVGLEKLDENTYYQPYATSLRIGDIGYQNYKEGKTGIKACYDSLDQYVASLSYAIETPCLDYELIGVKVDGEYRQLNHNILQIENEYYSTVRPKQITGVDEKPSLALKKRGVQYIELRSLDISVFDPLGVNIDQLNFLESLLIFCLLQDSPPIDRNEQRAIDLNESATAHRGRESGFQLYRHDKSIGLKQWGLEITDAMQGICEVLDSTVGGDEYQRALRIQREVFRDPEATPSAKIIHEMRENGESFFPYSMRYSKLHEAYFNGLKLEEDQTQFFTTAAEISHQKQHILEQSDTLSFEDYLQRYFSQQ